MNTIVNFETAKLLTHTDFNQKSVDDGYVISTGELSFDYAIDYMNRKAIAAPTIAEVVCWIFNTHKIWIVVNIAIDDNWYFELYNLKDKRNSEILINDESITEFHNSLTKAYQEAIKYCLTNLI